MDKLKHMETFVKIVRTGSLAKASEQLNISPPLASMHLKQLEEYLGSRLLIRSTRHIALTEVGQSYYQFCVDVIAQIEEEERYLQQSQKTPSGNIKISSPMMGFSNLKLASTVSEFLEMYPEIKISLILSDTRPTRSYLTEGGFDLAIVFGDLDESSMIGRRIGRVKHIACASPIYLSRHSAPKTPAELTRHNCMIHRKATPDSTWYFTRDSQQHSVRVSGTLETNSIFLVRDAVLANLGIGVLPTYCLGDGLDTGALVEVLPEYYLETQDIHVLFPYSQFLPYRIRAFIDYMVQSLED
jgi:DNA-binding transcriptional LysR family regulator